jgi:hypothetical protein
MSSPFYTLSQLAALAGCAHITVQKYVEKKKLRSFRMGRYGRGFRGKHIILAEEGARFISEYRMRRTLREADKLNP